MLKKPVNENYCATITKVKNIIPLENCDNVVHSNIFGNLVVVSKDTKIDDIGIFFPVETKLSNEFLKNNNLYRKPELNIDNTKKGYYEENGRIKCAKFRGNKSSGFFIPLESLKFTKYDLNSLKENDTFDELNGIKICEKYVVVQKNLPSTTAGKNRKNKSLKRISKMIDKQFNFHIDTAQLGKNIYRVKENDIIQCSSKIHGSSFISSNILTKRKLNLLEKFLKFIGIKIQDTEYSNVYASRKVIKNDELNPTKRDFYNYDIWGLANEKVKSYLQKGMTLYGEIVGYLPNNSYIQKDYDYGCKPGEFEIYIYRITYTNIEGKVFEFSAKQVQDWCKENGIKAVPEFYYGYAKDLYLKLLTKHAKNFKVVNLNFNNDFFLELLQLEYLEKNLDCNISAKVPDEGIVLRIEKNDIEPYKLKSFAFYEKETKDLDQGIIDIESGESIEEN